MNIFLKKDDPHRYCISEITELEYLVRQMSKSLVSEELSTSNMINVPKKCWNLRHSTFIIFLDYFQVSWIGKSLSYWSKILLLLVNPLAADEKYPVLNRDNLVIPIQKQLSQKQKNFFHLFETNWNFKHFFKKWPSWLLRFRNFGLQKRGKINVKKVRLQATLRQATW